MTSEPRPARGHRLVPHTADITVEAWAPTRETCLVEAVAGLVASFAELGGARPEFEATAELAADSDPDLLAAVLDEVIYLLDTRDAVPVTTEVAPAPGGVGCRFRLAPLARVSVVGPLPKAVTLYQIRCAPTPTGWSATVTIDV